MTKQYTEKEVKEMIPDYIQERVIANVIKNGMQIEDAIKEAFEYFIDLSHALAFGYHTNGKRCEFADDAKKAIMSNVYASCRR